MELPAETLTRMPMPERFTIHGLTPILVEAAAAVALGIAAFAAWAGGWRAEILGVGISVRAIWRPLIIAGALLVARWMLIDNRVSRLGQFSDAVARIVAGALLTAGLLGWTTHLSPYLGGADSYGYVSAAERLREGGLIHPEPLAAVLPSPGASGAAIPLGYVPAARVPGASVPAYPLGLPAMMAIAAGLAGPRAPFYVPLTMGVMLVAACCWMTFRWTRNAVIALAASAAVTFHPVVFAYAIQAMSDVPATACYLIAAAFLMTSRADCAIVGGVAAAVAFVTRPALLPGTAALALIPLASGDQRARRISAFGVPLALSIAAQAGLHWYLYGSPLGSGYGGAGELFSLRHLSTNARSYGYWGLLMHGPIWAIGIIAGLFVLRDASARALLVAALIAAIAPYAVYRPYDHWETLRFLLPLLVVATIYAVAGLFSGIRRAFGHHARTWIGLTLTIVVIAIWVRWLDREQVFNLRRAEERFAQAAELVERTTPANAVVLASLHSGSLRYYAHRQTIDWAKIPGGQFVTTVAALKSRGLPVFVLLDSQEEQSQFEVRHGRVIDTRGWLPAGQRRDVRLYESPP